MNQFSWSGYSLHYLSLSSLFALLLHGFIFMVWFYTSEVLDIIMFPANIYLFKVNNRNTRKGCEICSKLTIKTQLSLFVWLMKLSIVSYLDGRSNRRSKRFLKKQHPEVFFFSQNFFFFKFCLCKKYKLKLWQIIQRTDFI